MVLASAPEVLGKWLRVKSVFRVVEGALGLPVARSYVMLGVQDTTGVVKHWPFVICIPLFKGNAEKGRHFVPATLLVLTVSA